VSIEGLQPTVVLPFWHLQLPKWQNTITY